MRLALALKVLTLAQGRSGVRRIVVDGLLKLLDAKAYPVIPSQGSVGASGDLAPLAHMSCALIGEGAVRMDGVAIPARAALKRIGLQPITLGPKEGLALLNGTQISTALALDALFRSQDVFDAALVAGAMTMDACKGTDAPFDARIHQARGHKGQIEVAARLRALMDGSAIRESHLTGDDRVQDPYSLRCQPQVMGACLDVLNNAAATLEIEANAVTDNPLVFAEDNAILSGGNFHAEPVAFAADTISMAAAEIASLSERRIAILIDPRAFSGLPPFLVEEGGLNSGFMILQVTAAALVSENKTLRIPPASTRFRRPPTRKITSRWRRSPAARPATSPLMPRMSSRSNCSPPRKASISTRRSKRPPRSQRAHDKVRSVSPHLDRDRIARG